MTTGVAERRITDVADAAVRAGSRARATLAFALPTLVGHLVLGARGDVYFLAQFLVAWVVLIAAVVGVHTLIHGYHYGHREGRRSAWALVLLSGGVGAIAVWTAIAATGGRGAGKRAM